MTNHEAAETHLEKKKSLGLSAFPATEKVLYTQFIQQRTKGR